MTFGDSNQNIQQQMMAAQQQSMMRAQKGFWIEQYMADLIKQIYVELLKQEPQINELTEERCQWLAQQANMISTGLGLHMGILKKQ